MPKLTTCISELNRLYGRYHEAVEQQNKKDALDAWMTYFVYARRYHNERGLPMKEMAGGLLRCHEENG